GRGGNAEQLTVDAVDDDAERGQRHHLPLITARSTLIEDSAHIDDRRYRARLHGHRFSWCSLDSALSRRPPPLLHPFLSLSFPFLPLQPFQPFPPFLPVLVYFLNRACTLLCLYVPRSSYSYNSIDKAKYRFANSVEK